MRIGVGGQMTFLDGVKEKIEKSHRRSIGITEIDEINKVTELLLFHWRVQRIAEEKRKSCRVKFGADLSEWKRMVKGSKDYECSASWAITRGLVPRENIKKVSRT